MYYRRMELNIERLTTSEDDEEESVSDDNDDQLRDQPVSRRERAMQRTLALARKLSRKLRPLKCIADGLNIPAAIYDKLYRFILVCI